MMKIKYVHEVYNLNQKMLKSELKWEGGFVFLFNSRFDILIFIWIKVLSSRRWTTMCGMPTAAKRYKFSEVDNDMWNADSSRKGYRTLWHRTLRHWTLRHRSLRHWTIRHILQFRVYATAHFHSKFNLGWTLRHTIG